MSAHVGAPFARSLKFQDRRLCGAWPGLVVDLAILPDLFWQPEMLPGGLSHQDGWTAWTRHPADGPVAFLAPGILDLGVVRAVLQGVYHEEVYRFLFADDLGYLRHELYSRLYSDDRLAADLGVSFKGPMYADPTTNPRVSPTIKEPNELSVGIALDSLRRLADLQPEPERARLLEQVCAAQRWLEEPDALSVGIALHSLRRLADLQPEPERAQLLEQIYEARHCHAIGRFGLYLMRLARRA